MIRDDHGRTDMNDYFSGNFLVHLQGLKYQPLKSVLLPQIRHDPTAFYFGDADWRSVSEDLAPVPVEDRSSFILSLFLVVLADQWWYSYRRSRYDTWRKKYPIPKFGTMGLGTINQNPFQLLWIPEREGLVDVDAVLSLLPGFMLFVFWKTQFRDDEGMWRDPLYFIDSIRRDRAYQFNEGRIVQGLKAHWDAFTMQRFFPDDGTFAAMPKTLWAGREPPPDVLTPTMPSGWTASLSRWRF